MPIDEMGMDGGSTMTATQARRIEQAQDDLVRLAAPRLKAEPRPERKPEPVMVCRDNIKRVWSF
jgi:hypothetical protein